MNFEAIFSQHPEILTLIKQKKYCDKIDTVIKKQLPANLANFYKVIQIENNTLFINAENSMVASRLKMLLPALRAELSQYDIHQMKVKLDPKNQSIKKYNNTFSIPQETKIVLLQIADNISHSEVSAGLKKIIKQSK